MSEEARHALRRRMRDERRALPEEEVARHSAAVCALLAAIEELGRARAVMGYRAIEGEVRLDQFLACCWRRGQEVLLPRVEAGSDEMVAVPWRPGEALRPGPFGILEPGGRPWPPESIDAVLVPGLAFDRHGNRLGYGKGYYDRFLARVRPGTWVCGVAHRRQLVDCIPARPGDIRIPRLVTEEGLLEF